MMKVLLSVGIYLALVLVLGLLMAMMAPRQGYERDWPDDSV
jgi:hypothetical protein